MLKFNPSDLDAFTEEQLRGYMDKARKIISCSWAVVNFKSGENRWTPVLMFFDLKSNEFSHAFYFQTGEPEILALTSRLRASQRECDMRNG